MSGGYWLLIGRHPDLDNERKFPRQLVLLGLTLVGLVLIALVLPVSEGSRNQLMGLIGLLFSGIIAFSSTSAVANIVAGIMLRMTKLFRIGDYIRIDDHFGRVSERGLFATEIQSKNREFISLPNKYLFNNPVTVIRSSGTIISTTLSLGYDVHHSRIQPLLLKAAEESGLEDPFVHILELGNFSITYRISGLLTDVKWLITARSNLCQAVLDTLHLEGIEIMSPSYMNQRRANNDKKVIPATIHEEPIVHPKVAEDIVFDVAEQAEKIEKDKEKLLENIHENENALKNVQGDDRERLKDLIEKDREQLKALEQTKEDLNSDKDLSESESEKNN